MAEKRPPLTPDLRRRLGLPTTLPRPYPWGLAALIAAVGSGPIWLTGYRAAIVVFLAVTFVILPAMRWLERREHLERERLYTQGTEGFAEVTAVEPAGASRDDHLVRLDLFVGGQKIETTVYGCPLARKGLSPGEEVRVVYDERDPRRCLILERSRREVIDAVF